MDTKVQSIPGLNLLNSTTSLPAVNKSAMSSTATAIILKAQGGNPASGNPAPLQSLEDWMDCNPEPEAPQPQQKKKKKAPESLAIVPITLDPKDKTNWIGKLYGKARSRGHFITKSLADIRGYRILGTSTRTWNGH